MSERAVVPTQSALLELKDERAGMQEGYRFLDEKRLILASEILAELARYESEREAFEAGLARAARALAAAVARHGIEELGLYPADPPVTGRLALSPRSVLGVMVNDLELAIDGPGEPRACYFASPEAERCREAFRALLPGLATLACLAGNLERLRADYARTARRARAMEDVLLPEIDETLAAISSQLEELEREESLRAHFRREPD